MSAILMWLLLWAFAVWASGVSEIIATTLGHIIEAFS